MINLFEIISMYFTIRAKTNILKKNKQTNWVVEKGRYSRTRTWTWIILKCTFTVTKQLFFIPNVVFTAVFASTPKRQSCHSTYPYISACAKDTLAL